MRARQTHLFALALIGTFATANCSGVGDASGRAAADGGSAGNGPVSADDSEPSDLNGCSAAQYLDRSSEDDSRVIAIAAMGLTYTPKCLSVAIGQTVRWEGSLTAHPLAPGNPEDPNAGSVDNPIVATATGQSVEFRFDRAGTFPYFCTLHGYGNGQGMAGAIHVR